MKPAINVPAYSQSKARSAENRVPITTRAELRAALSIPPRVHREPLGALLTAAGSLHDTAVNRALALQEVNPQDRIGDLLLSSGEIGEDDLYRALAEQLGVWYVRLGDFDIDPAALATLAPEQARSHRLLPLMIEKGRLIVATDDPSDPAALNALKISTQHPIEPVLASPEDLDVAIATHYPAIGSDSFEIETERAEAPTPPLALDKPIVRLLNNLLIDAVRRRASDVHLRAREHNAEVLFRIDGSLVLIGEFGRAVLRAVVARIKVLASILADNSSCYFGEFSFSLPNAAPANTKLVQDGCLGSLRDDATCRQSNWRTIGWIDRRHFGMAEVLRLLHEGHSLQLIDMDLMCLGHREVVPQSQDFGRLNPGFHRVRA